MRGQSKGAHLWLRPARDRGDKGVERAAWVIKDDGAADRHGLGPTEGREAEKALADYIASKYQPARRERDIYEIPIADVISIYLRDVTSRTSTALRRRRNAASWIDFFGTDALERHHRGDLPGLCRVARIERRRSARPSRLSGCDQSSRKGRTPPRPCRPASQGPRAPALDDAQRGRQAPLDVLAGARSSRGQADRQAPTASLGPRAPDRRLYRQSAGSRLECVVAPR